MNNTGLLVTYTCADVNGNKHTNELEILEGQIIVEAGYNLNAIGNNVKGKYTWKNQWYFVSNGSGVLVTNDLINAKLIGTDFIIYGRWISIVTFNGRFYYDGSNDNGRQETVEVLKGQSVNSGFPGKFIVRHMVDGLSMITGISNQV